MNKLGGPTRVRGMSVRDIRFPTSLDADFANAVHPAPDSSCAYVVLFTDTGLKGHGMATTVGRGTELVVAAIKSLAPVVVGKSLRDLLGTNLGRTWRSLTSDPQLRWVGPEKGVTHLACAAIINALWDLWARYEHKPLWKLLADMPAEELVDTIDFRYISDALTKQEALEILNKMSKGKEMREAEILAIGYPAYISSAGWPGFTEGTVKQKCRQYASQGWKHFKIKIGHDLENDKKRCAAVRSAIGDQNLLMVDANQTFEVHEAIEWMKELAPYKIHWIEEPTSPDDILGHATISKALASYNIGVASGKLCYNRVMFKQFLQTGGLQYCTVDATRLGGVSEVLAVYLMAKKFKVPVCPHAGGVGLCEMVTHLQIWDFISVSGTTAHRMVEYSDHLEHHMKTPSKIHGGHYMPPKFPGYSVAMWEASLLAFEYPSGPQWLKLFKEGKYENPNSAKCPLAERPKDTHDVIVHR